MPNNIIMADAKGGSGKWTTDGIANRSEPNGAIIVMGNVIQTNAFSACTGITSVLCPNVKTIKAGAFNGCNGLRTFIAPEATSVEAAFSTCWYLESLVLPKTTKIIASILSNAMRYGQNGAVDAGADCVKIENSAFAGANKLSVLILRSSSIVQLANTYAFAYTPFENRGAGGTIYVPKSLYDHLGDGTSSDYKAASNWSTLDGYGTITWKAIEGSVYETQYADGTPIPTGG